MKDEELQKDLNHFVELGFIKKVWNSEEMDWGYRMTEHGEMYMSYDASNNYNNWSRQ